MGKRKINEELWEEFSNTSFDEQEKILSRARDLLLYLDILFDDDDKETFFIGSMALENAMYALKEKEVELIERFINSSPEVLKLWEEFLEKEGVEDDLKKDFFDLADEMEKELGDWENQPDTEADQKLRELIIEEVQKRERA